MSTVSVQTPIYKRWMCPGETSSPGFVHKLNNRAALPYLRKRPRTGCDFEINRHINVYVHSLEVNVKV